MRALLLLTAAAAVGLAAGCGGSGPAEVPTNPVPKPDKSEFSPGGVAQPGATDGQGAKPIK